MGSILLPPSDRSSSAVESVGLFRIIKFVKVLGALRNRRRFSSSSFFSFRMRIVDSIRDREAFDGEEIDFLNIFRSYILESYIN
jgi:hypothetical protein